MRDVIISPVRYGCAHIGNLERSHADLSLPDGNGDDGGEFPSALAIDFVVILRCRDGPSELCREIAPELVPEPEAFHIFVPLV